MNEIEEKINKELDKLRSHIDKINNSAAVYEKAESISKEIIGKQQKTDNAVQEITQIIQALKQYIGKLESHNNTSLPYLNKLTAIENKVIGIQNVVDIQKSKFNELETKIIPQLQKTNTTFEVLVKKGTIIEERIEDLKKKLNTGKAFRVILTFLYIFNFLLILFLIFMVIKHPEKLHAAIKYITRSLR